MSFIEIKDVSRTYKQSETVETKALKNVTLSIDKGEFIAISGPSGSGKTTLLNMIGGLDNPDSGSIILDGTQITDMKENQLAEVRLHNIGFIFQAYNLIPVLTAMENIEYIMMLQGMPEVDRRSKATEIAEQLEIETLLNKRPNEMSGGQQQRVAIARAIVAEPKLILADEPTANLDSKTGSNLLDMMKRLNEQKHITFIFSTHDKMVMEKAKRQIVLRDGEISG